VFIKNRKEKEGDFLIVGGADDGLSLPAKQTKVAYFKTASVRKWGTPNWVGEKTSAEKMRNISCPTKGF